jgi:integrase
MSIYKRGDVYWYKFMFDGKLVRESTKQSNDKKARNMESTHRARLADERKEREAACERLGCVAVLRCAECEKLFDADKAIKLESKVLCSDACRSTWEKKHTVVPTLAEFCANRIEPYAKPRSSWIWYRAGTRVLLKYDGLSNMRLHEIRGEHAAGFAAWRRSQNIEPGSINSSLRVLRRILRLAADWGVIEAAPKIELLPGETRRERVLTPEEEKAYLAAAAATPLLKDVATVLIDTGVRPDELHRMAWEHITWANGRHGTMMVMKGKTQAARRIIPMTPRVRAVLESRWESQGKPTAGWIWPAETKTGHIDHSTTRKAHRKALTNSKVAPFVLYSLRHTFLTRLGASGCDAWTLMRIAGHSSITISSRYVHPQEEAIQRAFANLAGESQPVAIGGRHKTRHSGQRRLLRASGRAAATTVVRRG